MNTIKEKISYIEGLAEGMDFYKDEKQGKFFSELMKVFHDLTDTLDHTIKRLAELEEYVEAIDEDLNDIEWDYYEGELDDDQDEYDYDVEADSEEYDDEEYYEVKCPTCHENILVEDDMLDVDESLEIICPNCDEIIIIDNPEYYFKEDEVEQQH